MSKKEPDVEVSESNKRETLIFGTRVTPEFLQLVDEAITASKGKYTNRTQLIRDAVELYARYVKEGGLKRPKQEEPEKLSGKEEEFELSVEKAKDLIDEWTIDELFVEDAEEYSEDLADKAKGKHLRRDVWRDSRVQKAMRKKLEDEIYPKGVWDGKRRFRKKKAKEWIEALRKHLGILGSAAKELVEDHDFKGEVYQEWL